MIWKGKRKEGRKGDEVRKGEEGRVEGINGGRNEERKEGRARKKMRVRKEGWKE